MTNDFELYLKSIRLYNFRHLMSYLTTRWQIFIIEEQRKFFAEFTYRDFLAQHYLIFSRNQQIGIVRLIYKNDLANISRVAILKKYRAQGYATKLMHHAISIIKNHHQINQIALYTTTKLVKFNANFGFVAAEQNYYYNIFYTKMIKKI